MRQAEGQRRRAGAGVLRPRQLLDLEAAGQWQSWHPSKTNVLLSFRVCAIQVCCCDGLFSERA